ncbi:meiotic recombination protein REC114-like, partial [Huso huso]
MAEAPGGSGTVFGTRSSTAPSLSSLLWHLKRYARFLPSETRVERDTGAEHKSSWKVVFESGAEGQLTLTIVQSGHFLISQGQGLLEGFSLIDAPSFLKVVRKADLLLFSLKIKNESRMFRMQFGGGLQGAGSGALWERRAHSAAVCNGEEPGHGATSAGDRFSQGSWVNIRSQRFRGQITNQTSCTVLAGRVEALPAAGLSALHSPERGAGPVPPAVPPGSELSSLCGAGGEGAPQDSKRV